LRELACVVLETATAEARQTYGWPGGNGRWETEIGDIVKFWLATVQMRFGCALFIYALALGVSAHAHDWRKPDLDGWYDSLHRYGFGACCSKDDSHETEAEIRGNDWWARVGRSTRQAEGKLDWELLDWVKIPAEVILPAQSNPTGSAVICHSGTFGGVVPEAVTVWCFVRLMES
jgi:hypothetical protein